MTIETYPEKYNRLLALIGKLNGEIAGPMSGFTQLHQKSLADGAISKKMKELIALSIAITSHCDGCIAYHVHDSLKAGATREEILETTGVAIMMGGGPALVYSCEVLEALTQFQTS
jgi:AhpD family alkylhydroperoxidase